MHEPADNHESAVDDGPLTITGPPGPTVADPASGARRRWFGRQAPQAATPFVEAVEKTPDDDQDGPRPRWNARVGSAALLSFLILVGALIGNRLSGSKPAATGQAEPSKARSKQGGKPSAAPAPDPAIAESPPPGDVPDDPPPLRPQRGPTPPTLQVVAAPTEPAADEPPGPVPAAEPTAQGEIRQASVDDAPPEALPDLPPDPPAEPAPTESVVSGDPPTDDPPPAVVEPAPPLAPADVATTDEPPSEPPAVVMQPSPSRDQPLRQSAPQPDPQSAPRPIAAVPDFAPSTIGDESESRPSYPTESERARWIAIPLGGGRRRAPVADSAGDGDEPGPTAATRAKAVGASPEAPIRAVPYVVRRGETFDSLARRYYGSSRFGRALWAANRRVVTSPESLAAGTTIRLPAFEDLDRDQAASRPDALLALPAVGEDEQPSRRVRQDMR